MTALIKSGKFSPAAALAWRTLRQGKLLAGNTKLDKLAPGDASAYMLTGLTLAPHALAGPNVCPFASRGCRAACNLWFSGQRVQPNSRNRALYNVVYLAREPEAFHWQLLRELALFEKRCARIGRQPLVRLNVASDLEWSHVIERFPRVTFFDYTKSRDRFWRYLNGELPPNYALTFSASENTSPGLWANFLRRGGNVSLVFDVLYQSGGRYSPWQKGALPAFVTWDGETFPVVDGDLHDVRLPHVDGRGVIVGLRLKGTRAAKARARASGFAVDANGQPRQ